MNRFEVRTLEGAIAYITDCNLATVCSMACKKSKTKYEFERQISIAQTAIDWMIQLKVDFSSTRAKDVVEHFGGSVADWAAQWGKELK